MKEIVAIALVASLSSSAMAFHLNPLNRNSDRDNHSRKFLDLISENVHERITNTGRGIFLKKCETAENKAGCEYERDLMKGKVIQDSLIRGVWWNDDPNQNLYEARHVTWLGYMNDAERRVKKGVNINSTYKMQYRSHYGDLQFLHSMASRDGEEASKTKEDILMWAEFSYKVSTGAIENGATFSSVKINRLHQYFDRQADWKINWILQPRYRLVDTKNDLQEHALGTLVHMIEDSYSAAHVARDYSETPKCKYGRILSFHSYTHQRPSLHSKADTWSGYVSARYQEGSAPESVVAELIAFSHRRADWETEVRPYLDRTVYCFDGDPDKSGPGSF